MITRKTLKGARQARQGNAAQDSLIGLMREGERAKRDGLTPTDCPYTDDRRECWMDGFTDAEA